LKKLRRYGKPPYKVAVIHGGPGAPGSVAPIARELSHDFGVLEPFQTATSLNGQVIELKKVLNKNGKIPITLIGHSWGAWLSFIIAARYPSMVKKLILVSSGPFEQKYVEKLQANRLNRLNQQERKEYNTIIKLLNNPKIKDKDKALERLGALTSKTDTFDPFPIEFQKSDLIDVKGDIFHKVWKEAAELRTSGKLLTLGKDIKCPVIAIHGDYDPHPAQGVKKPLSIIIKDFRFILLKNCGHYPWLERKAKDKFYKILRKVLK
jgi:pimeloyl-ACP methyl ester carboxylesterase